MAYASKSDMAGISTVNGRQDMTSLYLSDSVRGNGGPFETFCLPDLPFVGGVGGGGGAIKPRKVDRGTVRRALYRAPYS